MKILKKSTLYNVTKGYFNNYPLLGYSSKGKDTFTIYRCSRAGIAIREHRSTLKCKLYRQECYDVECYMKTSIYKKI